MKHQYYSVEAGTTVDLMCWNDDMWLITRVEVNRKFRGQGHASRMLDLVCADADAERATLVLSVEPDGTGLDTAALMAFYFKRGFVPLAEDDPHALIRTPK